MPSAPHASGRPGRSLLLGPLGVPGLLVLVAFLTAITVGVRWLFDRVATQATTPCTTVQCSGLPAATPWPTLGYPFLATPTPHPGLGTGP